MEGSIGEVCVLCKEIVLGGVGGGIDRGGDVEM